jgi:hypothetical protein
MTTIHIMLRHIQNDLQRTSQNSKFHQVNKMTRMNIFSVSKITKNWLILFKIEVKKTILFEPITGKKLIKRHI